MAFAIHSSSYEIARQRRSAGYETVRYGLIAGAVGVYLALVGLVEVMQKRWLIEGWLPTGLLLLGIAPAVVGNMLARSTSRMPTGLFQGALAGAIAGLVVAQLPAVAAGFPLRSIFIAAGPELMRILSFQNGIGGALVGLPLTGAAMGLAGAALAKARPAVATPVVRGLVAVLVVSVLRDVLVSVIDNFAPASGLSRAVFGKSGLNPATAIVIFLAGFVASAAQPAISSALSGRDDLRRGLMLGAAAFGILVVLTLPVITNAFVAQVMMMVGLYVLMSLGLNIELGFAGLVDMGFVAFFAIGAYTVALLSSSSAYALADLSFWTCLPIAIVVSILAGFVFGLPVLRIRGDYLAMATLGLGEIVRILVLSDALKPYLGASQGIEAVTRPQIGELVLNTPGRLYYLTIALVVVVAILSSRLRHSAIGRAWLALREDEDVAQALGIDPVNMKLLAYMVGAAFAGAAGAVFAVLTGGVYPHSFQLLVSMNVLAILIVGGLGSLGGVICGALVLIGLPELLREFGEYRYLVYGFVLIFMMRYRPSGLWPAR